MPINVNDLDLTRTMPSIPSENSSFSEEHENQFDEYIETKPVY